MVAILQALAHPVRLRVVATLCREAQCVGVLAQQLQLAQPIVSQQLRVLRLARLVTVVREGGRARYSVSRRGAVQDLVRSLTHCSQPRPVAEG